jgi:glycosyltransferase involved in cell wall biosynthesis
MTRVAVLENHAIGTVTVRVELMQALRTRGYDPWILTGGDEDAMRRLSETGLNFVDVGSSSTGVLGILSYLRRLFRALHLVKPEACLTFTIRPLIYGNLLCFFLRIPTLTNVTGLGPLFESKSTIYRIARFLYKRMLSVPRVIFFQNDDDRRLLLEKNWVDEPRAVRIPGSGVNCERFQSIEASKNKTVDEKLFSFVVVSRLVRDKGICEYVDAARMVKKEFSSVRFVLVGPIWNQNVKSLAITEEEVQSWQDEGIIDYLGESDDVRPIVGQCDCLVLPSYREGMSNTLLEGAAMEKPLIATDVPGCRDIVIDGKSGYLCEAQSAAALAQRMVDMIKLSDEERLAMGKAGRAFVVSTFDRKIVIEAYVTALASVLDGRPS